MLAQRSSKRACDICRRRKVKCDGQTPSCKTCNDNHIVCLYAEVPRKRGPKSGRRESRFASPSNTTATVETVTNDQHASTPHNASFPNPQRLEALLNSPVHTPQQAGLDVESPSTIISTSSAVVGADSQRFAALGLYDSLLYSITSASPGHSFGEIIEACVSIYTDNLYAYAPLVHEPSLRSLIRLLSQEASRPGQLSYCARLRMESQSELLNTLRKITLLMTVCAAVTSHASDAHWPHLVRTAQPFLHYVEESLKIFQFWDISHPVADSIALRVILSATYHSMGKGRLSWHMNAQARLIALDLRLYREESLVQYDPLEAHLLRIGFWTLLIMERATGILHNRPVLLQSALLDGEIDIKYPNNSSVALLDPERKHNTKDYEQRLVLGHDLSRRLWTYASDFLLALKGRFSNLIYIDGSMRELKRDDEEVLTMLYFSFTGVLDDLPEWLQNPDTITHDDKEIESHHRRSFWVHRANLMVSFHCLKMVILRRCMEKGATSCMGLSDQPMLLEMKRTEFAADFLKELALLPHEAVRLNGEFGVEKIRPVGTAMLELSQTSTNPQIVTRAKAYLARIVDILARLESRVPAELEAEMSTQAEAGLVVSWTRP